MSFNDDEQILANQDISVGSEMFRGGKTKLTIISKTQAPLEESNLKVMVELRAAGSGGDRLGVDLVTVLDVSLSMEGEGKLEVMNSAMQFLIKTLSPIDRLAVITFNYHSNKLCPLCQMTENSKAEIGNLVNALAIGGGTNMVSGLQAALKVLNGRKIKSGRVVGIVLMSDGHQNSDSDAAKVAVGMVPVYTFGFGADHDPTVLMAIADNSMGGTFSEVQDNLSIALTQCFAGLLTVVVQDLKLTVTKEDSIIEKVSAGNYPQCMDDAAARSVTISFGDLFAKELRKVIVDLLLPAVKSGQVADVLMITYTYSTGGRVFETNPIIVGIRRTGERSVEPEREEVVIEEKRLQAAQMMKERYMADKTNLEGARLMLVDAQKKLDGMDDDGANPFIKMLESELRQVVMLMQSQEIYK